MRPVAGQFSHRTTVDIEEEEDDDDNQYASEREDRPHGRLINVFFNFLCNYNWWVVGGGWVLTGRVQYRLCAGCTSRATMPSSKFVAINFYK